MKAGPRFSPFDLMPASGIDDSRLMFAFAHDVRTYLRTVLISLQLIQRGGAAMLPAEDQLMLKEALSAAGDINELLNAMMAYVDAKSDHALMNLPLLLQGVLIERKAALQQAGAEVEVANDLDLPVPVALQNVLKELLTNAGKFRDPERPLRIRIATGLAQDETLEITVSDNGPGVPPSFHDKIFTPFQRLHSREKFPGFGLGLPTCRRIAAAWGGSITTESVPAGGLTVRVTVPPQP